METIYEGAETGETQDTSKHTDQSNTIKLKVGLSQVVGYQGETLSGNLHDRSTIQINPHSVSLYRKHSTAKKKKKKQKKESKSPKSNFVQLLILIGGLALLGLILLLILIFKFTTG